MLWVNHSHHSVSQSLEYIGQHSETSECQRTGLEVLEEAWESLTSKVTANASLEDTTIPGLNSLSTKGSTEEDNAPPPWYCNLTCRWATAWQLVIRPCICGTAWAINNCITIRVNPGINWKLVLMSAWDADNIQTRCELWIEKRGASSGGRLTDNTLEGTLQAF